jgi:tetratricopeptide (TPR) repeat protein
LLGAGDYLEAAASFEHAATQFDDRRDPELGAQVAEAMSERVYALRLAGQYEAAVAAADALLEKFSDHPPFGKLDVLADGMLDKASSLRALQREEEADAVYGMLVERFHAESDPKLRRTVDTTLAFIAGRLLERGHADAAARAYAEVETRIGIPDDREGIALAADALYGGSRALARAGRIAEAIAGYDRLVERYGDASDPALLLRVAQALSAKANALVRSGRGDQAIAAYDELIERFANSTQPDIQPELAKAIHLRGLELNRLARLDEALAAYDAMLARFGDAEDPVTRRRTARVLASKANALLALGRSTEALVVSEALERLEPSLHGRQPTDVAEGLLNHGLALLMEQRPSEALEKLQAVISQHRGDADPGLRRQVALALTNRADALVQLGRTEEAMAAWEEVVDGYADEALAVLGDTARHFDMATHATGRNQLASALFRRAILLEAVGRRAEAVAVLTELIDRFGDDDEPVVEQFLSAAWHAREQMLEDDG